MSNRVDDLETKVSELQAAVNGLTEELVETKERVRQLENAVDVDDPLSRAKQPRERTAETDDADSDADAAEPDDETDAEPEQRFVDAEQHERELQAETETDEEAKSTEEKEDEKESEQESSDIIVA